MAIGAKSRDVLLQFLVEAVVISLFGGLIGIGFGFALSDILEYSVPIVMKQQGWLPVFHIPAGALDDFIDMAIDENYIQVAIIVVVQELNPPANKWLAHRSKVRGNRAI